MWQQFLVAAAVLWAAGTEPSEALSEDAVPRRPHVVILYADDLGYGDIQYMAPETGRIPTPRVDRLMSEGMTFTDAHSSSAVCSPSRYTLLTGRYHWRTRLQSGIVGLWGKPLIGPERTTIGTLAQQAGYRTACVGKWHLGWDWPIEDDERAYLKTTGYRGRKDLAATDEHRRVWADVFSRPIPGGPTAVGFDEYFGTDVPNWPPYCFIRNERTIGIPSDYAAPELFARNQASQQGPAVAGWTLEPILPALGEQAAEFIRRSASESVPFLLYVPLTSPHTPLSVNDGWKGRSGLNLYADFVMETDAVVGRILDELENSGVAEETLVVFTSDNGCAPYINAAELEEKGHFPSGPFRGYKSDVWEGGHRVPFAVRWPGHVRPGSRCEALVHQADLLRTLADILGSSLGADAGEDSFSLVPLLQETGGSGRTNAVSCSSKGLPGVRSGRWKYIPGPGSGGWSSGGDENPVQLYDLADDPGETRNLSAVQPEQLRVMKELLEELIVAGRSTAGKRQSNDVRVRRYP